MLWSEIETRIYTPKSDSLNLAVQCPLLLSYTETGTINTVVSNSLDEEAEPVVVADISRNGDAQEFSEILTLPPHTSKAMFWNVDASNIIFGRMILISVTQRPYRDLQSRQGYCGILLLDLLGLRGWQMLFLICSASLLCLILGAALWLKIYTAMDEQTRTVTRAFGSLAIFASLGLVSAILRWWGLTMILDGIVLMLIGVIFTEVLFNPR